jgi:kojibiose phosphorylase
LRLTIINHCVVVEDAASGIEAAKAAGMRVVGLGPVSRVGSADVVFAGLDGVHLNDVFKVLADAPRA